MEERDLKGVIAGIFTVRREDWPRFREMMEDAASNFATWEEWKQSAEEGERKLRSRGIEVQEVLVDLDDFEIWCRRKGRALDGASRAAYVNRRTLGLGGED